MGVKYFYNFCVVSLDDTDLKGDILSAVRRSYFDDFDKIRDRITVDSEGEYLSYDYCIEKDKTLKWTVRSGDGTVLQDVSQSDSGRYYLCFYRDRMLFKRLLFSRLHTLLKVEYTDRSGAVCCSVEPRKLNEGICLLYKSKDIDEPLVLSDMPYIGDERIRARVEEGFTDYTVEASTNEGVVRYLTDEQRTLFYSFVDRVQEELDSAVEESFVGDEAPLHDKINAKDFNIKRNLSGALDITQARDFGAPAEEESEEEDIEEMTAQAEDTEEALPDVSQEAEETEDDPAKPDKLIIADGAVYSYYGELDEKGNRSGYGRTMTDLGRTAYEGTYLNDKRSGTGSYYYKDGTLCYSGEWAENARHGVGIGVSARDGSIHIGKWKNNKPEGSGVRVSADGEIKFVCKELPDGRTVLMTYNDDDTVVISQYDADGSKTAEKTISLTDF